MNFTIQMAKNYSSISLSFALLIENCYFCDSIIIIMAVTKLKRKEAKNRSRMTKRVDNIKRLKLVTAIASPYKGISGIVLEDQENQ